MTVVRTARVATGVAALLVLLTACTSNAGGSPTTSAPASSASPRPSSTAKLTIVTPANGSVVHGSTVDLRLRLEGAKIVPATTQDIRPDRGHIHVILDGQLISMNYQLQNAIADVKPGPHLLQAEFVASDHAPFDPRVIAVTSFEVKP
ncbi:MAG: hypothetical protein ACXVP7_02870 [Actinomycetota bacterium]